MLPSSLHSSPFLFPSVPSFHSLLPLLSCLSAGSMFVLANLIILAILFSSGSFTFPNLSAFIRPPPFLCTRSTTAACAVSETRKGGCLRYHVAAVVPDRVPLKDQLAIVPAPSAESHQQTGASEITPRTSKLCQLAMEESKQAVATSNTDELLARSKPDHEINTPYLGTTDPRRAKPMYSLSVSPTQEGKLSSSAIVVSNSSEITNTYLSDDDFQRKCEEFIAKFRASIRKEALK